MGKYKEENGTTRVGDWLRRAKDVVPEIGEVVIDGIVNPGSIIGNAVDLLKEKAKTKEEAAILLREYEMRKMEFDREVFQLEVSDRQGARALYREDSSVQKKIAISFMIGYFILVAGGVSALFYLKSNGIEVDASTVAIVSHISGAIGGKMGTIMDFFFGSKMKDV